MPPFNIKNYPGQKVNDADALDNIMNSISAELDKASVILADVDMSLDDVREHFDLYDFSDDTINTWQANFSDVMRRLEGETEEFDRFAFDGDSIRIEDEEDDEV